MRFHERRMILFSISFLLVAIVSGQGIAAQIVPAIVVPPVSPAFWPDCSAPTIITLDQFISDGLARIPGPDSTGNKRSLTPSCSTYYELDNMILDTDTYSGDCQSSGYCDYHLQFDCIIAAGCLFEVDHTWLAAGVTYPSNCPAPARGLCVSQGTNVSARGFAYIDDHGTYEFHPVASYIINA